MSDDLVTRLRRAVIWNGVVPHGDFLAMEAADEIERNRATLKTQTTLLGDMLAEIERLKAIIAAKLHQRRCYDCGEVEWTSKAVGHVHTCDECYRRFLRRLKEVEA